VYPGPFTLVPLTLVLLVCIGALTLPGIQRVILKPGRSIGEIKPFLRLLAFVCALMLAIFSILLASGAFNQLSQ
jgi:hypothetical protein